MYTRCQIVSSGWICTNVAFKCYLVSWFWILACVSTDIVCFLLSSPDCQFGLDQVLNDCHTYSATHVICFKLITISCLNVLQFITCV